MFRVALVQNQSEMAHYGYADARPLIRDLGYDDVTLFTADNIDTLGAALGRNQFDAIIFGSNALNDKTIRHESGRAEFRSAFRAWLSQGRGCLIFHQLRLVALEDTTLGFLPEPLNTIAASARPPTEKSADGAIGGEPSAANHLLLYPNPVGASAIRDGAINFRSLPGLYWHSWTDVNLADWEIVLFDPIDPTGGAERPLLVSSREPRPYRVVVSALTLDWQKQRLLLQNLLTYVVEGRHSTALLLDQRNRNTAFEYLIGTLRSRKYPFKQYFAGDDPALTRHISNGVHSVLLLGPLVELARLPVKLTQAIMARLASGQLKLVTTEAAEPDIRRFSVAGRERRAQRLLPDVEIRIQTELRVGYIDGSFWSTAETLQTLQVLPGVGAKYDTLADKALELAAAHDRAGSYDEVFGVSCAFLWMRGRFLGVNHADTQATLGWIRSRIDRYEPREQALAYLTLGDLKLCTENEGRALAQLLRNLDIAKLSEIDLVVYIRAALMGGEASIIPSLVDALGNKQVGGAWVDLATTAAGVAALVDVLDQLRRGASMSTHVKSRVEDLVFRGVIHIQEALERSGAAGGDASYPWDGKASTTVKCIQAWLRFEELIDLPVHELVDVLEGYDRDATRLLAGRQALSVLEDLKRENENLRVSGAKSRVALDGAQRDNALAMRRLRGAYFLALSLTFAAYVLVTIVGGVIFREGHSKGVATLGEVLKFATFDSWEVHFGVLGVIAGFGLHQTVRARLRGGDGA